MYRLHTRRLLSETPILRLLFLFDAFFILVYLYQKHTGVSSTDFGLAGTKFYTQSNIAPFWQMQALPYG
jgi:hypothetical protein